MQKYCLEVVFLLIAFFDLYIYYYFHVFLNSCSKLAYTKKIFWSILYAKKRRVISYADKIQRCMRSPLFRKTREKTVQCCPNQIILVAQSIAVDPAGGATPTAGKQQTYYKMFEPNSQVIFLNKNIL